MSSIYSTTPRNLLLLFDVPNILEDQFSKLLAIHLFYSSSVPLMM